MKRQFAILGLTLLFCASLAFAYNTKVYHEQGGDRVVVASGGTITVEDGGGIITAVEVITATPFTATIAESSKTYVVNKSDATVTLPSTSAGAELCFSVMAIAATTGFSISPAAADAIHYITSTDDKDLINTAATDVEGDSVCLIGDGAEGWWVKSITGTWAKE